MEEPSDVSRKIHDELTLYDRSLPDDPVGVDSCVAQKPSMLFLQ